MDHQTKHPRSTSTNGRWNIFDDLRAANERRAERLRLRDVQRFRGTDWSTQVACRHRQRSGD
ncbi:MAG: hypothetical protein ACRDMJ_05830 [Solirubrobacteraceae bacterium]